MECQRWYAWHSRGPAISLLGRASDLNWGRNLVQMTWVNLSVNYLSIMLKHAWLTWSFTEKLAMPLPGVACYLSG